MKKKKSKIKTTRKASKLQVFLRRAVNKAKIAFTWIGVIAVVIVLVRWLP